MGYLIGIFVVAGTIWLQLAVSAELSLFVDSASIIVPILLIYGLSVMSFGLPETLRSISGIKHLATSGPAEGREYADIYKRQIHFALIAACIMFLSSSIAIALLAEDFSAFGPVVAIPLLGCFYPLLFAGVIFYPLHLKFRSGI